MPFLLSATLLVYWAGTSYITPSGVFPDEGITFVAPLAADFAAVAAVPRNGIVAAGVWR
jgi:hypothetical protein